MATLKTTQNDLSVEAHVQAIADPVRRQDCQALVALMRQITGEEPRMWGPSIVGFGSYHYRYESGHEGDSCLIGFASRKQDLALYLHLGAPEVNELLPRLGKHKAGKGCLNLKRLADVDASVLEDMIRRSYGEARRRYL
jgi:hypothetical protein